MKARVVLSPTMAQWHATITFEPPDPGGPCGFSSRSRDVVTSLTEHLLAAKGVAKSDATWNTELSEYPFCIYPRLSDNAIAELHDKITEALEEDDRLPEGQKKFGVREFPDWRIQCDVLEDELRKRGRIFAPADWTPRAS